MTAGLVLLAYDGSAGAANAIRVAAGLIGPRPALVATVWEEGLGALPAFGAPDLSMGVGPVDVEAAREVDEAVHRRAERLAGEGVEIARAAGFDAQPAVVADEVNVPETLVHLAEERGAGLIVVGSRGLSGLRSRLLGSTSHAVLRHAHGPVLVIPTPHE
jgi:nucleotide-binding universal stress UspA family protein